MTVVSCVKKDIRLINPLTMINHVAEIIGMRRQNKESR